MRKAHRYVALLMLTIWTGAADTPSLPPKRAGKQVGIASWYGHPFHGRRAANGEVYDMEKFTAAHRTLPFGTQVRVVNLLNEKTVTVRINDRGPFVDGRIIDLSHAAARAIDMDHPGIRPVRVEVIASPGAIPPAQFAVQVGAFAVIENAQNYAATMKGRYGTAKVLERDGDPVLWRVLVGAENDQDAATALANRIRQESGQTAFVVRVDP